MEAAVASLAAKHDDARKVAVGLTTALQQVPHPPWPEIVDHFALLSTQLNRLVSELEGPEGAVLRHFVAQPVGITPANPELIPNILSSKLPPELEEEMAKVSSENKEILSQDRIEESLEELEGSLEEWNELCTFFFEEFDGQDVNLDWSPQSATSTRPSSVARCNHLLHIMSTGEGLRERRPPVSPTAPLSVGTSPSCPYTPGAQHGTARPGAPPHQQQPLAHPPLPPGMAHIVQAAPGAAGPAAFRLMHPPPGANAPLLQPAGQPTQGPYQGM
mmetsp:Transcript_37567/g.94442  ORF Transcript_37567/g.94442 Transcript_37567/m.94442 type:complete len:274 (-) Transcript_37567:195-1016(-)|eukprot:CAMPEP_0177683618 /NCGR_PEP_ID=MMETSP0447-20121125/31909_1 /TAXON_ID=0 /ORGANISM="Stygamoeba regulata, Strain BSH-02190019" /LENGTH=273 /DNA_ID=CAMNT_0019193241 /DNA_START=83 /DNA_END=904 /DNA_ORIENTATION=+